MEPEADQLILESLNINYIDESEYPSTTNIQNRCRSVLDTPLTTGADAVTMHVGWRSAVWLQCMSLVRHADCICSKG